MALGHAYLFTSIRPGAPWERARDLNGGVRINPS
jgi:hypothetical protein